MSATYEIQKFNADGKVFYKVFRKTHKGTGGLVYEQCGSFDRQDRAEEYVKALEREDHKERDIPDTNVGNMISRRNAIDGLDVHYIERINLNDWQAGWNAALDWMKDVYLDELPSAQPEPEHTMEEFMYGQDLGSPEDGSL